MKINIIMDYDVENNKVISIEKVIINEEEFQKKVKRVSKIKEPKDLTSLEVIRSDNNLTLSDGLISMLELTTGESISVRYEVNENTSFPVIGKDSSFGEEGTGNKLTKSKTVSCRGKQNSTLSEFGTNFIAELYKPGIYKLIGDKNSELMTGIPVTEEDKKDLSDLIDLKNTDIQDIIFN